MIKSAVSNQSQNSESPPIVSRLKKIRIILSTNSLVRGFVGTFALISLVSEFVGLENYEIAKALNAIVIGWDLIAVRIGQFITFLLPFIPELNATAINTLAFLASVSIPSLFGVMEMFMPIVRSGKEELSLTLRFITPLLIFCLFYIFIVGPVLYFTGNLEWLRETAPLAQSNSKMFNHLSDMHYISHLFIMLVMPFWVALLVKPYRIGAFFVLGGILMVEALYYAPITSKYIVSFSDFIYSMQ